MPVGSIPILPPPPAVRSRPAIKSSMLAPADPTPMIFKTTAGAFKPPSASPQEVLNNPRKAAEFIDDYMSREANFFKVARNPVSKLTYDGMQLSSISGAPLQIRLWSAPSKESLDIGLCIKALEGHPLAVKVVGSGDPAQARANAADILGGKLQSYRKYYQENPGYGGFMPWFLQDGAGGVRPTDDWVGDCPGLDNGEWVWSMLVAEQALRKHGHAELADGYKQYVDMLRDKVVPMFYDAEAGKIRADVHIVDPSSPNSTYETIHGKPGRQDYLTGEHGVHEGGMMVLFATLFGKGLTQEAKDKICDGIPMQRVESPYGTTWQGFWGSSHESWAYLFLPLRDMPQYRDLFRLREEIRSQNAVARGYPGLASSCLDPKSDGYLDGAGIEGIGSQPIRNNHIFAIYGAFPMLLQFAARPCHGNYGLAWLSNMLGADKAFGPLGAMESGTNDGQHVAFMKTIDGSFTNILAMCGGLEKETGHMLKSCGVYDEFQRLMQRQYDRGFAAEPLREPGGFVPPGTPVPSRYLPTRG